MLKYTFLFNCDLKIKYGVLFLLVYFHQNMLIGQDTSKSQTIKIVSDYKPVLRPSTKLSFSASPLPPAPFTDNFKYLLPDQQFKVMMKPVDLVPAAFKSDSIKFTNQHFVKLGYGNFQRIYADAGMSLGAGKPTQVQLNAGYHSIKGNLRFQENNRAYADLFLQTYRNNHRLNTNVSFQRRNYFYYGIDTANIAAKQDSLRQTFSRFNAEIDLSNNTPNVYGITYKPSLRISLFNDLRSNEVNALVRLPFSLNVGSNSKFSLQLNADLTQFNPADTTSYQNHIVGVYPSFNFPVKDLNFDLGGQVAWDQGELNFLPQIGLEAFVGSNRAILLAGWKSSIQKNNYQHLTDLNPWIRQPLAQFNTRTDEIFAGLRGHLPANIQYRFRAGIKNFQRLPLFINVKQPSVFDIIYEESLETFNVNATVEYLYSEKISAAASMELFQTIKQQDASRPWHFIPLQVNFSAIWKPVKNVSVQSKIYGWQGPYVKTDMANQFKRLPAVVDANIEADVRLSKIFTAWLQLNNIFNQAYQRWYQYPVVGIQIVGGIRLNFEGIK